LEAKMFTKGRRTVAGDHKQWDANLQAKILWKVCDIGNSFYNDGRDHERELLWFDIVHSCHVARGETYMISHGNPSGNPMTSLISSIYHMIAKRVVFVKKTGRPASEYTDFITGNVYGDDDITSISDEIEMGQDDWTEGFKEIGMTYTREDKTQGAGVQYRDLTECSFLKRGFKQVPGHYMTVAPLHLDTVLEMPLWVKTETGVEEEVVSNIHTCFEELALHGPAIYDHWTKIIFENARKHLTLLPEVVPWAIMMERVTKIKPAIGLDSGAARVEQQTPNAGSTLAVLVESGHARSIGECTLPKTKVTHPACGPEGLIRPQEGIN